jgi:TM2 domain-containing membrane protein YozV
LFRNIVYLGPQPGGINFVAVAFSINSLFWGDVMNDGTYSPKSRLVALLLCIFFGWLGIHRFYVGKVGTGILMIVTLGGLGIWTLVDLIIIIVGSFTDKQGKLLFHWTEPGSI